MNKKRQSTPAIYGGQLVRNSYTGQIARVINITVDPFHIPGYHLGDPAIMAYVVGESWSDYWLIEECQPVAQVVGMFDTVEVADSFGHTGFGAVLDVIGADIVIELEDDGEIYLLHSSYVVSVIPAQQFAKAG